MSEKGSQKGDDTLILRIRSETTDRQSVRATFKLAEEFIDTVGILSAHLGIRQKSLFDYLLEDTDSLKDFVRSQERIMPERKSRVPKTFVISRKTLASLDKISREMGISRDDLVEYAILRLLPILLRERRQQRKREDALARIGFQYHRFVELRVEVEGIVGNDDPIVGFLDEVMGLYRNAYNDMEMIVQKGKKIIELPLERFRG